MGRAIYVFQRKCDLEDVWYLDKHYANKRSLAMKKLTPAMWKCVVDDIEPYSSLFLLHENNHYVPVLINRELVAFEAAHKADEEAESIKMHAERQHLIAGALRQGCYPN
ncbi:hypothetical protein B5M09_013199 [Aphanomyces astaci]|uniref:Uncharacterized protein n=1 Tax=Aphanomyces astaci TaxID=112090 RepID=A0A3R7Y4B0_APHAT|nr:hypothetical protein B5M09_013199 [Aphanomyces astaci]